MGQRVQLITEGFREAFHRFPRRDRLNTWREDKDARRGDQARVTRTYGDETVTLKFDDGWKCDVPFEAIRTVPGSPPPADDDDEESSSSSESEEE